MPPIVAFIGKSNSGKTTIIEKLLRELKSRGYRVATIKHSGRDLVFDKPGTDSWRQLQAGSEMAIVAGTSRLMLIKPISAQTGPEEIARVLGEDLDIILAEGFKKSSVPKVEVHRKDIGLPLTKIDKLIAIVTDEPLPVATRQFSPDDTPGLADLLEKDFIRPQSERTIVYVNNKPLTLSNFPKEIENNIVLSVISTLKGVAGLKALRSVEVFLRRKP
jgi:molybdopterin-guanine dinucleotide biosynthesis adapter protein